jgi:TRAP-type C4-dicarboxylate transport system substrate-binding protein
MNPLPLVAAAVLAAALATPVAQAQTTLTASSWVPPAHPLTAQAFMVWLKEVEDATQGRVKFNVLPKAPVAPPQTFDAVKDGIIDVSFTVHGYTPGRFIATKMTEFVALGDSAEAISVAYQRMHDKHLAALGEHKGVKVIGVFSHGPGHVYTVKTPVQSVADLAGMKIRVGGGVVNEYTRALGANPLLKPSSEAYQMLQTGVADGIFFPAESIPGFKLQSVVRHGTHVPGGIYNTSFVMMMNEAKYNALPAGDKAVIDKLSGEHFARLAGRMWDKADAAGIDTMKAAGVAIQTASPAFVAELRTRLDPVEVAWDAEMKKRGIDGAALMKEFRAAIAAAKP